MLVQSFISQSECSYIKNNQATTQFFVVENSIDDDTFNFLLAHGWRKFGMEFFKPVCEECKECVPIRVPVKLFKISKSQRRVLKKNKDIKIKYNPLTYSDEIYNIYVDHCSRFPQESMNKENFIRSFYTPSVKALQAEYYLNNELVAVGFLDVTHEAISSVYFIYKNQYQHLKLGTFSILKEIEYTRKIGYKYYYLGYFIKENQRMAYKNNFKPNEKMNWETEKWYYDID